MARLPTQGIVLAYGEIGVLKTQHHASGEPNQLGRSGRKHGVLALDESNGVVERLGKRNEHHIWRAGAALCDSPGDEGIPASGGDEGESGFNLLNFDARFENDSLELGAIRNLTSGGVAPAVVGVVEDKVASGEIGNSDR